MTIQATNLGFPRIGARRELKKATEGYWSGRLEDGELKDIGRELRKRHWSLQAECGLDVIPSNDFSYYDQVLDMIAMLGAIPERFADIGDGKDLTTYFAMARGTDQAPAMEMTKWFDTNYHYIVPEFCHDQHFSLSSSKAIDEFLEARELGIHTRPVLIGPVSFLLLGKLRDEPCRPLDLLQRLLPVYRELLQRLVAAGADWVQIDEPFLAMDLDESARDAFQQAYDGLAGSGVRLLLATYFEGLRDNRHLACRLPVAGLHLDRIRGNDHLDELAAELHPDQTVSLGVVDGRNIWRSDLDATLELLEQARELLGQRPLQIAPSCSLLHVPVDLSLERHLDDELAAMLAFGRQKLEEISALARALNGQGDQARSTFEDSRRTLHARSSSDRIHNTAVAQRLAAVGPDDVVRDSSYPVRRKVQQAHLNLPGFPTTTIGSLPQTMEVRRTRAAWRRGDIDDATYRSFIERQIDHAIEFQERIGLDVLVHGEFERNDMVEYFGEKLEGFAFTDNGWVQSYGSRCVKPPIIFGDVRRPEAMTTQWLRYAQSCTRRPVKAMLTGPVTMLQWSFVRDDQPRSDTCQQIALALRDEVADLESAGARAIQVDEPALREGLPLRRADHDDYLDWATCSFRLATSVAGNSTQIHTHMCYSEFNDIMPAIAALDADVISIEASRSAMELLDAFVDFDYPNEIGPGIWDIHSPRVPSSEAMTRLLERAASVIDRDRLWVNPDCGLKTRDWPEVEQALTHLVAAARTMRESTSQRHSA
ncbi:5-methyltetrahydropteroyltriglutamate--homocysteine S-methyltransferase [Wenzhouxiangella sp. AB-CW3]|uniref:5-methyltetrahydropteroyltriglutamate-- homocysteine S-methyltransferase n=1 Tax=Wenzhouxiangella sp. AB-CW3 TaxID=2771012 RepID=UPI00168B8A02|nr:5-methyltetrahydropteroyltriglutamate--homocysteine S-methyltransferase [Wenzhouxiangella sp. AB-CW3]QOC22468.1 5-methyltetrahydropteroyltriglutamate--homocysteine S-methyltransferase [Wenzhouxiangella sp. AB-CW3]